MTESESLKQTEIDTRIHIDRVRFYMMQMVHDLLNRIMKHDASKLGPEELPIFAKVNHKLKASTYGSPEYKELLKELGPALEHHYRNNTNHHPDALPNGINDFSLCDVLELMADWMAAVERHDNGNIFSSIEHNKTRFRMSDQLCKILENTAKKLKTS